MTNFTQWVDVNNQLGTHLINIVAGDIGGTKSWLAWFTHKPNQPSVIQFEQCYVSANFASASDLIRQFIADAGHAVVYPDRLLLALPGPVESGGVRLTNLDWFVDIKSLQQELAIADVRLVNDFQAAAAGVATLKKSDYVELNHGVARVGGVRVITGAGTGLGLAWMQADVGGVYRTFATEGGHIDFASSDELQSKLLSWLQMRFQHVSWERILSGAGLSLVYEFLITQIHTRALDSVPEAGQIHDLAVAGDSVSLEAVQLFVDVYAAWVGNMVLLYQPKGGLFIAGGVAIHLQNWVVTTRFMEIAAAKGRMADLVRQTPIYLVTNARLGLQGAMQIALN
ncbi:glucokinase [Sulfuriferula nivalis]|uniref:Glucokinase n=1 Tax=Sulfuriferula nivalis TaxID=2675298 RepID=A0A809RID4_9PROT|nr:glucokinase [Sulfuriferula nivalis]BBP01275.1 glucokinase [Sulfuriferula nivalis]